MELLGVVWSIEYFKNYFYGKENLVITDHGVLLTVLKEHCSNKLSNSRLSRRVDCFLSFQLKIEHLTGDKTVLVDYNSRNPRQLAKSNSKHKGKFLVATLSNINSDTISSKRKNFPPFILKNSVYVTYLMCELLIALLPLRPNLITQQPNHDNKVLSIDHAPQVH